MIMLWYYDFDEGLWEAVTESAAKKKEPVRCVCGREADIPCHYCKMTLCVGSWCHAKHREQYHSRDWSYRL